MRIHTNRWELYETPIREALKAEQAAGRIAGHVTFKQLTRHRSRSHMAAYEIQLEAGERDRGRRAGNSGSYGAMRPEHDGYAATFDEWGWLLAAIYEIDPDLVVGAPAQPIYAGRADFHARTGFTYHPDLVAILADPAGDPYPVKQGRDLTGQRSRGRATVDAVRSYWPHKVAPRTPEWARAFRAGEVF